MQKCVVSIELNDEENASTVFSFYLVRVVGEVDFMEDLCRFVLDSLHFHLVRRILSLPVSQRLLQPLERVGGDGMTARPQE